MDIDKLIEAIRLCGSQPNVRQCRNYQSWRKAPAFRHGDISHTLLPRKEILRGLH